MPPPGETVSQVVDLYGLFFQVFYFAKNSHNIPTPYLFNIGFSVTPSKKFDSNIFHFGSTSCNHRHHHHHQSQYQFLHNQYR